MAENVLSALPGPLAQELKSIRRAIGDGRCDVEVHEAKLTRSAVRAHIVQLIVRDGANRAHCALYCAAEFAGQQICDSVLPAACFAQRPIRIARLTIAIKSGILQTCNPFNGYFTIWCDDAIVGPFAITFALISRLKYNNTRDKELAAMKKRVAELEAQLSPGAPPPYPEPVVAQLPMFGDGGADFDGDEM